MRRTRINADRGSGPLPPRARRLGERAPGRGRSCRGAPSALGRSPAPEHPCCLRLTHPMHASLANEQFELAYRHAASVGPAGTLPPFQPQAVWLMFDLVEAAYGRGTPRRRPTTYGPRRSQGWPRIHRGSPCSSPRQEPSPTPRTGANDSESPTPRRKANGGSSTGLECIWSTASSSGGCAPSAERAPS